jgi:transcriptional regulator with XRE-family HTH domain
MIRARQNGGKSLRAIAADLGISPSTASLAARDKALDQLLQEIRS